MTLDGSGLRYNDGKPNLSLIPVAIWWPLVNWKGSTTAAYALEFFEHVQKRDFLMASELFDELIRHIDADEIIALTRVLEYGERKYHAWNWAAGMKWSTVLASGLRHLVLGILQGEELDSESGLPHIGHVLCNAMFLRTYVQTYELGNDMPPEGTLANGVYDNSSDGG